MKALVTGSAGFIGKNLVEALGNAGHLAARFDSELHPRLNLFDKEALSYSLKNADVVFHLAANADVRRGPEHPGLDFLVNAQGTLALLEAMRETGCRRIVFASTGSVYGENQPVPTPETAKFPRQTSFYGASKLAAEAFISAYCEAFGFQSHIMRLVSVLGPGYSHGHVLDFVRALERDPTRLHVLGDGMQRKSYVHVSDVVKAMIHVSLFEDAPLWNVWNVGTDEAATVRQNVQTICGELGVNPEVRYGTESRGWIGDVPEILLDCAKLRMNGWTPAWSIKDAVIDTVRYIKGRPGPLPTPS